jgi:PAS domain S-box-containing protein
MPPLQPTPTTGPTEKVQEEVIDFQSDTGWLMRWKARVVREAGRIRWEGFDISASALAERVFGITSTVKTGELWSKVNAPDIAVMNARSQQAILSGRRAYEQEFRVVRDRRLFWLHEQVAIRPTSADSWELEGVITDVSADRETQNLQVASEGEVQQILTVADCLLWRARVFQSQAEIGADWVLSIPRSNLYRKLFGKDPPEHPTALWNLRMVPELAAMNARSSAALLSGESEYEQEFRVLMGERVLFMHEHVSIEVVAPGEWSLTGILMDVTAARRAEEERRQSEARIQQILARADCMIWQAHVERLDPDFVDLRWSLYLPWSELYERLFKPFPGETPALDWDRLKVPEYREMMSHSRSALRAGAHGYEQEFHVPCGEEAPVWLREQVSIRPAGPGAWDLIGFITDVSARRAAEEACRKSEAQIQQLLTAADCLIWQAVVTDDGAGGYKWDVYAPRSVLYTKLFGEGPVSTTDGSLVLDWWALKVPELSEMQALYKDAIKSGLPGYAHDFRAFVGERTYWLREQVSIKRLCAGRHEFVGVITDISDRREAELALAAEKERLAVTLRAMAEGVITTDTAGRVQFINPAAAGLTGYDAPEAVGRLISEVCVLLDEKSGSPSGVSGELAVQRDRIAELPAQTLLVTRSGTRRIVEGCFAPVHSADSKVIGSVLVFRDVTERERLGQELVRASRLESVGILAGGIAHDYNNILTAIMGNLSMAMLDADAESEMSNCLKEAQRATLSARDLTQQLLTFAKGGEPVRAAVDLAAIVRDVSDFALHGSIVKSAFDLPGDLWPIDADKGQIGRVVQNLVINAVQAMPGGGVVRICARNEEVTGMGRPSATPGDYVHISIADSGTGIKQEYLSRIFDPYFTTKQSGSGLGLAAVYSIVKKHRGVIEVESECGKGTTFHFWLPALPGGRPAPESDQSGRLKRLNGRVLFMDDEASIRSMAAGLMRRIGLDIVTVADGCEAVEQFKAAKEEGRPFSLVIMDLTVPGGMGGREAIGLLRAIDPKVKAVVSSGYSSDPILANYRDFGFCGVASKPYDALKFSRVIGESLGVA